MHIPISWLREFIDFDLGASELADLLTMSGTEVEAIHRFGEGIEGVRVGDVVAVREHPNADRLVICDVIHEAGADPVEIVCGAPNVAAGMRVAVAPPGAVLPGGFRLEARKLRGVLSHGMILAEDELGLSDDHAGVLELNDEFELGADLSRYVPLSDEVLELSVTPNRGDCLSLLGVAREIHALTGAPIRMPESSDNGEGSADSIRVEIDDTEGCPRYAARVLRGVTVGPSPLLWRTRLHRAAIRPINNVVDATNITLLELGQPQHAFDLAHFPEGIVRVRASKPGESFVALDGSEHNLSEGCVLVTADDRPVAIGGVMGGLDSAVTESTADVLLESAYFCPSSIRRSARSLRLSTDSSYRFERGVDSDMVPSAAARTAQLLVRHAGATLSSPLVDSGTGQRSTIQVSLRRARIPAVLGMEVADGDVATILERLGFSPVESEDGWTTTVPAFRHDIEREIDLVEEVARIHGYDRIPEGRVLAGGVPSGPTRFEGLTRTMEEGLVAAGYAGICGNSLVSPRDLERLTISVESAPALLNPLGEDQSLLRPSLLPALTAVAALNANRSTRDLRIFEIGKTFADRGGRHEFGAEERFVETNSLAFLSMGRRTAEHWDASDDAPTDFYDARGLVDVLLERVGIRGARCVPGSGAPLDGDHSGTIEIDGEAVGSIGVLDGAVADAVGLAEGVVIGQLDLDALLPHVVTDRTVDPPSRYPPIRRDLSLVVPEGIHFEELSTRIQVAVEGMLQDVGVFDVYEMDDGQRSVALRLVYRAADRTLTDDEVNGAQDRVIQALTGDLGVTVRGLV